MSASTVSAAANDVLAERNRQIECEGHTPEQDDQYRHSEMAMAAACYAAGERLFRPMNHHNGFPDLMALWPWDLQWWKPKDRRSNLVRAGALILAEIERLDRGNVEPPNPLTPLE